MKYRNIADVDLDTTDVELYLITGEIGHLDEKEPPKPRRVEANRGQLHDVSDEKWAEEVIEHDYALREGLKVRITDAVTETGEMCRNTFNLYMERRGMMDRWEKFYDALKMLVLGLYWLSLGSVVVTASVASVERHVGGYAYTVLSGGVALLCYQLYSNWVKHWAHVGSHRANGKS